MKRIGSSRFAMTGALASALLVSACGGDDQDTSRDNDNDDAAVTDDPNDGDDGASVSDVSLYITDDFSNDYEAVWISINQISFFDGTNETVAFDGGSAPLVVNVPELKRAGLFVGDISIPAGSTSVRLHVDDGVRLVSPDGTSTEVTLSLEEGGYIALPLDGYNPSTGTLIVDFDLPAFTLSGSVLQAAIVLGDDQDASSWTTKYGEIDGAVTAISSDSISVRDDNGKTYAIGLTSYTTYRGATTGWTPSVESQVEVDVIVSGTLANPEYTATSIAAEDLSNYSEGYNSPEIEGHITAIEGNRLTVTVREAEDIRLSGSVTIDISNAVFTRGNAASLAVGREIEVYLDPTANSDGSWNARLVEIEGAADSNSISDDDASGDVYSEVEGRVIGLSGQQVTLDIYKVEGILSYNIGDDVTFDLAQTQFTEGSLSCLGIGSNLELKGYTSVNGSFVVNTAEIDGACAGSDDEFAGEASGAMEAEGLITSIGADSFVIDVLKVDDWFGAVPSSLTVTYDNNTYFEDLRRSDLRVGLLVEAEGAVTNDVMAARKIELE